MGELSAEQLGSYRSDGFVRLEAAFPTELALRCQEVLWTQLEEEREDPSTWRRPVVRLGSQSDPAFAQAAQSPRWVEAIHEVAGPESDPTPWMGGTFPIRFPVEGDPGDDGWHIDGSFMGPDGHWWANYRSRDRALLMLVLFSELGTDDAPTRIRVGSHLAVPDLLRPYGEEGLNSLELEIPPEVHHSPMALATGQPGDVFLCHPFLLHAAQRSCGVTPRFIAQPGVPWKPSVGGLAI